MKWIMYLLLIFNVSFIAWHYKSSTLDNENISQDLDVTHENQLVLLSEYYKSKNSKGLFKGSELCYSLGPFSRKSKSKKAETVLKESGAAVKRLQLRDTSRKGFWVILPSSKSRKEAKKHIKKLKRLKVTDYFLVAKGSHANAVSLGVYSQKKLARRRIDEMIRLGFIPRMESVPLPRKVYWLNWYKKAEKQPEYSILTKLKKQYPKITRIERSCK